MSKPLDWSAPPTRFVLFTGKGGVGKTTVAAANAVALADAGLRVLLVSTDPASNLSDVFETTTGEHPEPVGAVAGLDLMDLDPQVAADEYRARVIDPYRGVLPDAEVAALEEKLAGACTVEVAAFDTFARLLAEPQLIAAYDHVIFDTAPTGHTLRLLQLARRVERVPRRQPDATSCLGPLGGVQDHRPIYAAAVATLRDATQTTVVLVARPDVRALAVAASAAAELHDLGIDHQTLVVNGVLAQPLAGDPIAQAYAIEQQSALEQIPSPLDRLPVAMVPLAATDLVGVAALRRLAGPAGAGRDGGTMPARRRMSVLSMSDLVDELERAGHGVILVTGKGGVGKTTVARLIAEDLARRGQRVHLSTTDPAGRTPNTAEDLPRLDDERDRS